MKDSRTVGGGAMTNLHYLVISYVSELVTWVSELGGRKYNACCL